MLASSTIAALRKGITAGEFTPRDIVLDVAKSIEAGNAQIGAYLSWDVDAALAEYRAVIVVGSDCLGYDAAYLGDAAVALERGFDAVLGPALDGGYVLAGFTRLPSAVFAGVPWGTDVVLARQRERFAALGLRWHELPGRADIDRPQDLWRLGDAAQALAIGRTSP